MILRLAGVVALFSRNEGAASCRSRMASRNYILGMPTPSRCSPPTKGFQNQNGGAGIENDKAGGERGACRWPRLASNATGRHYPPRSARPKLSVSNFCLSAPPPPALLTNKEEAMNEEKIYNTWLFCAGCGNPLKMLWNLRDKHNTSWMGSCQCGIDYELTVGLFMPNGLFGRLKQKTVETT